jgi:hypothetical protein
MVYQLGTAIRANTANATTRRTVLKSAGWLALCSVAIPLRSLADVVKPDEPEQAVGTECSVCKLVHGNRKCSANL